MRYRHDFMLSGSVCYMCRHCGIWQKISSFDWLALLHCKIHERTCFGRFR